MGERHTRQGEPRQAVAQTRGPDDYEERDWPVRPSTRGGSKMNLTVISGGGCWCGQHWGHAWPGEADGAPHPR